MKKIAHLLPLVWLACLGSPSQLAAQTLAQDSCTDFVYLTNGSRYQGHITEIRQEGTELKAVFLATNSGLNLSLAGKDIRKIVQKCPNEPAPQPKPYRFREHGRYMATRLGTLTGTVYWGEHATGLYLQQSVGYQWNRLLGAGIGAGFEVFETGDLGDIPSYPVFAEMRGYLLPKNTTPYYMVSAGYAFAGKFTPEESTWWTTQRTTGWDGGWMAQASLGYRIGQHFTLDFGVRFQSKSRNWATSDWQGRETQTGVDNILHKRFTLALGIIL